MVLESIYFGLNLLINLGITSAPFTKEPTSGNSKFFVGVIILNFHQDIHGVLYKNHYLDRL